MNVNQIDNTTNMHTLVLLGETQCVLYNTNKKDKKDKKDIENLESDIIKINEIFNDLHVLIHDQHQNFDNIIDHIDIVQTNAITAHTELTNAYELKKSTEKMQFTLYGLIGFITSFNIFKLF